MFRHPAVKWLSAVLATILFQDVVAQWSVPDRIILDGDTEEKRQVTGLSDPLSTDAAASVEAVRSGATTLAYTNGGALLQGDLAPAPQGYSPGMVVTVIPSSANHAGAMIELNNLGAREIVKAGGIPLDSADLFPGSPARFIYDGTRFRLLGSTALPCRTGYQVGGHEYCIADSSMSDLPFYEAIVECSERGARLCSYSEWLHACLSDPGFIGTVLDYEWVDDAANSTNGAKRVGNGGDGLAGTIPGIDCKHGGTTSPNTSHRYRCCTHR